MSDTITPEFSWDSNLGFFFLEQAQVCFHCHHYNLFINKTVDDALGFSKGNQLRTQASASAWRPILKSFQNQVQTATPQDLLATFSAVFGAMGHGVLPLQTLTSPQGSFTTHSLHYSQGWLASMEAEPSRYPIDAMAAGFAQAAIEVAFELEPGSIQVRETTCIARGQEVCEFRISERKTPLAPNPTANKEQLIELPTHAPTGMKDEEIETIASSFRAMLATVAGDERGIVEAFGILVTLAPTDFYNIICFEMLESLRDEHPALREVSESMLYEAGRLCGFNTFGGVLRSPEWEALLGRERSRDPLETLLHCCAIARSFGFGRWSIAEYIPRKMCVLRAHATYEDAHITSVRTPTQSPSCYLYTGAAEAMVRLAEDVDWANVSAFDRAYYDDHVQSTDETWQAEQTLCPSKGDDYVEIVVKRWG